MNQYNRLLDPKKDIGRYSGTLAIYLLVMTLVTVLWECLGWYSLSYLYFHWTLSF